MTAPSIEFVYCAAPDGREAAAPRPAHRARAGHRTLTVDIHCHALSRRAEALMRPHFTLAREPTLAFATEHTREINRRQREAVDEHLTSAARRLRDMDAAGIDVQAISPAPTQYYYWAEPGLGREASRMVNEDMAALAAEEPRRFVALGTVPLQDTELAIQEMRYCVGALGMRGIEINSNVAGEELASPRIEPFFAAAAELGTLLFLHPLGFSQGERLSRHYLNNVIGNPLESTIAVSHLVFGGVLDRHPGLKLCVAHGGGYLPYYTGRMDHAHGARADCREHLTRRPSDCLRGLYFDSVVFDPAQLSYLVRTYGADRVLLGTDYPYDMSENDPVGFVCSADAIDDEARDHVLGGNAIRLLGLEPLNRFGSQS